MKMTWLYLVIYGLACYRLAVLLSEDAGPAKMFQKFRSFLKKEAKHNTPLRKTDLHHGVECLRCSSVWMASVVAAYAYHREAMDGWGVAVVDIVLLCMALSAMSILFNRAFPHR